MTAGTQAQVSKLLGALRLSLAKRFNLVDPSRYEFLWVVDFPLFDWDADDKRWVAMHHPFTSPSDADLARMTEAPGEVTAKAYDLVLNGSEIGGGSIRIHDPEIQRQLFRLLGISDDEAKLRFGFFIDALEFGTPPLARASRTGPNGVSANTAPRSWISIPTRRSGLSEP